jgi:hypothetical protein
VSASADDGNGDGAVDQMDFEHFELCFSGPGATPPLNRDCFDADADEDVDCVGRWAFEDNWTGPPASPPEHVGCPDCYCADLDRDGSRVDLSDFSLFSVCFGLRAPTAQCPQDLFGCADLNQDEWVNLTDFNTFSVLFGTVSTGVPPDCVVP